jgi:hypothetical protein
MKKLFKCFCGETSGELAVGQESDMCPSCKRTYGCAQNSKTQVLVVFETKKSKSNRKHPKKDVNTYDRILCVPLDDPIKKVVAGEEFCRYGAEMQYRIKLTSLRVRVLSESPVCSCCGLKGEYWALERHKRSDQDMYHINMYGTVEDEEVMLCKYKPLKGVKAVVLCKTCLCQEDKGAA